MGAVHRQLFCIESVRAAVDIHECPGPVTRCGCFFLSFLSYSCCARIDGVANEVTQVLGILVSRSFRANFTSCGTPMYPG